MREQPEQQPPPVQRLRVRYAKRGRLRFASHRDFSRAFERALVRARIPMAYSSGFNPHPRISYAGAAPTGSSSEAEYLEIGLAEVCDPGDVRDRLDEALPPGLDVVDVVPSAGGGLADRLEASVWRIELPGARRGPLEEAVAAFLAAEELNVQRMTKRGMRRFDCRAAVTRLTLVGEEDESEATDDSATDSDSGPLTRECAILEVVLRHGTPSVRPDDVLAGLRELSGFEVVAAALFERMAQGPWDEETGTVGDPLQADRDAM